MNDNWILTSERLPENEDRVLAYDKNSGFVISWYSAEDNRWGHSLRNCPYTAHWMPLSEPPEL